MQIQPKQIHLKQAHLKQGRLFSSLEVDGCRDGDFPSARQGAARVEMTLFGTGDSNYSNSKHANYEWNRYHRLNPRAKTIGIEGVRRARQALAAQSKREGERKSEREHEAKEHEIKEKARAKEKERTEASYCYKKAA